MNPETPSAIKGHLMMSNDCSLDVARTKGVCGVYAEKSDAKHAGKTRADILADLSCVRVGDRVFFYNTNNTGFYGIYEVASEPFYSEEDIGYAADAPYQVN